jgi:hypothetical protein
MKLKNMLSRNMTWKNNPRRKRRINEPQDWIKVQCWNLSDHSDKDIKVFICAELDVLNLSAGIMHLPGDHKNRNN